LHKFDLLIFNLGFLYPKMKKTLLYSMLACLAITGYGQPFYDIHAPLTGMMHTAVRWADYDIDGNPDAILTGENYLAKTRNIFTKTYHNDRNDKFSEHRNNFISVTHGAMDWGDYDNDGDEDLLITGETAKGKLATKLYNNHRNGSFSEVKTNFVGVRDGSARFADLDNDGWLDIIISGQAVNGLPIIKIYRNLGKNCFSEVYTSIAPVFDGKIDVGDYDSDGDIDVLVCGKTINNQIISKVYRNDGSFRFYDIKAPLIGVYQSDCRWGDYDHDGDLDIALCGETANHQIITNVYRNIGSNRFVDTKANIVGVRAGSVDWGDCDADGDLDLLVTGETAGKSIVSLVYLNYVSRGFIDCNAGLHGVYLSSAKWGDYDHDGDLDILLSGLDADYHFISKIYKNQRRSGLIAGCEKIGKAPVFTAPKSIWNISVEIPEKKKPVYYYVYATCYCTPDTVRHVDLNAFVSDVFYCKPDSYVLHELYNGKVMIDLPNWPEIDEGYRCVGFLTKAEAEKSRAKVIKEYQSQDFKVQEIVWKESESGKIIWFPKTHVTIPKYYDPLDKYYYYSDDNLKSEK